VNITIREPTRADLEDLATRLHPDDVAELEAAGWESPLAALMYSHQACREVYVASWDGKVQAAFGVADYPHDVDYGTPWFLSTGPRGRIRREFLRLSREYIAAWAPMYRGMFNLVDVRHVRAQRWLMHLGFQALKVHDLNGHPFIEFGILAPCAAP
jgi:hypothetical protein